MKYSSRLMTLLMALMLCIAFNGMAFADATGVTLPDGTDVDADDITSSETEAETTIANYYAELAALGTPTAIYAKLYSLYSSDKSLYNAYIDALDANEVELVCTTCLGTLVSKYVSAWPAASHNCLYDQLGSLTASAAYDLLNSYVTDTRATDDLYLAYTDCHNNHYYNDSLEYPCVICSRECCTKYVQRSPVRPGKDYHDSTCPWSKEEYTPQLPTVTTSPDVTSPDELKNATTVVLTAPATGTNYAWQKSVYPVSDTSWVAMDGETGSTLTLDISAATIQYAYRCIITTTASDGTETTTTTAPLYLGGEEFLAWIYTATGVLDWLKNDNSMEYIIVAYENHLLGIALSEVIYLTNGTLIELEGGTTLAIQDENNQLIDVRYKLAVAQVVDGAIVPLN